MTHLFALLAWLASHVAPHTPPAPSSQPAPPAASTQPATQEAPHSIERRAFLALHESPYDALVLAAAEEHGLCMWQLLALLWVEFRLQPRVRHRKSKAAGIAQISAGGRAALRRLTGRAFTRSDALEPATAVKGAAVLLRHMRERCGAARMLGAYGTGRCVRLPSFERQVERQTRWYRGRARRPWAQR